MALECIHGFEEGFCDTCYPKKAPEPLPPTPRGTPKRTPGVRARTAPIGVAKPAAAPPRVDVTAQRIYHVTHIRNLAAILSSGELSAGATPAVDVSSDVTRELRRTAEVSHGVSVADHVPFYLSPDASPWQELREGAAGVHWSAAARAASASDFVILVAALGGVSDETVLADGDAARSLTRFAVGRDALTRMMHRVLADEQSIFDAEALVPDRVPFDAIAVIGVANTRVRDQVREALAASPFSPKVAVHPPWFIGVAD